MFPGRSQQGQCHKHAMSLITQTDLVFIHLRWRGSLFPLGFFTLCVSFAPYPPWACPLSPLLPSRGPTLLPRSSEPPRHCGHRPRGGSREPLSAQHADVTLFTRLRVIFRSKITEC
jgi:hypothetical protein